jgi:hypothetical protein
MNDLGVSADVTPNELSRAPLVRLRAVRSGPEPLSGTAIETLVRYFRILLDWDDCARTEVEDRKAA